MLLAELELVVGLEAGSRPSNEVVQDQLQTKDEVFQEEALTGLIPEDCPTSRHQHVKQRSRS